jgi:hypothetical protein
LTATAREVLDRYVCFCYGSFQLCNQTNQHLYREGKRFVNESMGYKEIPEYTLKQPYAMRCMVYDARIAPEEGQGPGHHNR